MSRVEPDVPKPRVRLGDLEYAIDLIIMLGLSLNLRREFRLKTLRHGGKSSCGRSSLQRLIIGVPAIRELRGELPEP